MSSSRLGGALSPLPPRSSAPSPSRQKFPGDTLRPHMRTILSSTLYGLEWDANNKARMSQVSKQVSEKVKAKMLELVPRGFKYIVTVTLSENLGQAGRADMTCHWEDTDSAIQEMFSNDSIIFVCVAFAVRGSMIYPDMVGVGARAGPWDVNSARSTWRVPTNPPRDRANMYHN